MLCAMSKVSLSQFARVLFTSLALSPVTALPLFADQVEMQNGDHYMGKVVVLTGETLVLQSDVLGRIELPRKKVSSISFGVGASPAVTASPVRVATNAILQAPLRSQPTTNTELSRAIGQLGTNSSVVAQVQKQFLADAGPEANAKFNEMLGGLMSGKISLSDLRSQAQSAAQQMRAMRKDLGDDAGPALDGYLEILDKFLAETSSMSDASLTNSTVIIK